MAYINGDEVLFSANINMTGGGSVDVTGKLDEVTITTPLDQAYVKKANGSQTMVDIVDTDYGSIPNNSKGLVTGRMVLREIDTYAGSVNELLAEKQNKLRAGDNITISEDGTISATGGGGSNGGDHRGRL